MVTQLFSTTWYTSVPPGDDQVCTSNRSAASSAILAALTTRSVHHTIVLRVCSFVVSGGRSHVATSFTFLLPQRSYRNPSDVYNITCCLRNCCGVIRNSCNLCTLPIVKITLCSSTTSIHLAFRLQQLDSYLNNGVVVFYLICVII